MYASFILEDMEKGMKDSQGALGEFFNPFKDDEFWYAFLEQSVQTYFGLIQTGKIVDIPTDVERALERIGDTQNEYKYPGKKKLKNAKKAMGAQWASRAHSSLPPALQMLAFERPFSRPPCQGPGQKKQFTESTFRSARAHLSAVLAPLLARVV